MAQGHAVAEATEQPLDNPLDFAYTEYNEGRREMNGKHIMVPAARQEYRVMVNTNPSENAWITYRGSYLFLLTVAAAWTKKGCQVNGIYMIPMGD